ncbi:hypothetical protein NQU17_02475 [Clostridiaceae bacterium HFYG-1003]|nr:hypothetical protein NQU17_02475 [Clostridiaceae bacterium HFYG-1003]
MKAVPIKAEKTKEERIRSEKNRLVRIYKEISKENKSIIDGLINRAAFMRVTLEDMEKDLDDKGFVEEFSQSEKLEPYERERPVARLYNTMNKNYQSIIKQLSDLLPAEKPIEKKDPSDEMDLRTYARAK